MAVTAQPVPPPVEQDPDVPTVPIYRLSVKQYHAMARAGILTEDDPVELLEGWLARKMTKHRPHSICTQLTREALERLPSREWYVSVQDPITTADSEPEPDLAIIRGTARDYPDRQPIPADLLLIIEVADATLSTDRGAKKRPYARAGISVYWIANLMERKFEVYTDPTGPVPEPDYRQRHDYGPEETIPVFLDGAEVGQLAVRELLP